MNLGDYVSIKLAKKEIKGTLLESYDKDVLLIKLDSGYNIGIPKLNVYGSRVIRKFKSEKKEFAIPKGTGKKKIGLIITGGTIASKLDSRTGAVKWITEVGEFAKYYPEIFEVVDVARIEMPFMIASESMTSEHWIKIAEICQEILNDDIDGVIVTHGTDFLHYTSAALSFMLNDLNKPVVLTYSQRSIDRASSDANLNLRCAAKFAISDCAEVVLVGHATSEDDFCYALRGTKVRKMHTSKRDAFKPINCEPVAKIYPNKIEFLSEYNARRQGKAELDKKFNDKIVLVKFYPGQKPDILDYYASNYKGIVVEASGLGHLLVSESKNNWIPKLKKHIKNGFIVCAAPQPFYGRLNPKVYSNGRELIGAGVIFLEDMLPETAFVKLGWVLGHRNWNVKEKMLENISGEFNEF